MCLALPAHLQHAPHLVHKLRRAHLAVLQPGEEFGDGVLGRVGAQGSDAVAGLAELSGGLDKLAANVTGYAQNYYSRDEIAGGKARDIQAALASLGITGDIGGAADAKSQFRALVEGTDVTSEAGKKQLAALLGLQGDFASLADYLNETGKTLAETASQAPAFDNVMSPLLSTADQQVQLAQQSMDIQYETRDATLQVVDAVKELISVINDSSSSGRGWVSTFKMPEVGLA